MDQNADTAARKAAEDFTSQLAASLEDRLGPHCLGIYRIGSLAHGGFSRRYSDIDIAVIAEEGLDAGTLDLARKIATDLSPAHGPKLSIFWSDRAFSMGRFPPLDRVDFIDHAVTLVEREAVRPARPSLDAIRAYLRGQPLESYREQVRRCVAITRLGPADHRPFLRALLYPARFVYSWSRGAMASNDDAVAFLRENPPAGFAIDLVERALRFRQEARDLDEVLPAREALPRQLAACERLAAQSAA